MEFKDRAIKLKDYLNENYLNDSSILDVSSVEKKIRYPDKLVIKNEYFIKNKSDSRIGYYEVSNDFNKSSYITEEDVRQDDSVSLIVNLLKMSSQCEMNNDDLLKIIFELEKIRKYSEDYIPNTNSNISMEMILKETKNEISSSFDYYFNFVKDTSIDPVCIKIGTQFNHKIFYQQYCDKIKEQFDIEFSYESFLSNTEESFKTFGLMIY